MNNRLLKLENGATAFLGAALTALSGTGALVFATDIVGIHNQTGCYLEAISKFSPGVLTSCFSLPPPFLVSLSSDLSCLKVLFMPIKIILKLAGQI